MRHNIRKKNSGLEIMTIKILIQTTGEIITKLKATSALWEKH